jgi:MoaA/NifB/PqqE/SkfB family radical SAM enzyme
MNSKRSKEEILFKTVKENNILPITSICKLNCIFCSHKNNPSEIETYSFGHLEFDLIKKMIEFLDPEQPVFIGESASKIIEGEPFVHPDIYKILNYIRQRWPEIEIKITSSGSFLQPEKVDLLKKLEPLELNISLNGPAPEERVFLMNDTRPDNVFKLIPELKKQRIKFDSSIVSMHHLKGCNYLKRTFDFLEKYPPQSLRVFLQGLVVLQMKI